MPETEAAVCYLLKKAAPHKVSKTALIKFCYFADLEHTRRFGTSITDVQWKRDSYGAVAYDIPNVARTIPGVDVFDYTTYTNAHGTDFCAGPEMENLERDLTAHAKAVLDAVYEKYRYWQAKTMGDATKKTAPWIAAEEADQVDLDLSVVAPAPADRFAYMAEVLKSVDLSVQGTPEEIAEFENEVDDYMLPFRLEACGDA